MAASIGKRLAQAAIAAKVNDAIVDLDSELPAGNGEVTFQVLTDKDKEALAVLRHSCAHIMARAVLRLFPGAQLAFGPALENCFYYDIDSPTPIREEDFPRIEEEMRKIVADAEPFERFERSTNEARELVRERRHYVRERLLGVSPLGYLAAKVLLFAALGLAPLVLLSRRLARRSSGLNAELNDQLEREVEVIEDGGDAAVSDHYRRLARHQIRLSDLGAWNFLQMEFFVLALIVAALARYCSRPGVEAGDIYAVFSYVMMFVGGLDCVPILTQQLARLHDIGGRVAHADGE